MGVDEMGGVEPEGESFFVAGFSGELVHSGLPAELFAQVLRHAFAARFGPPSDDEGHARQRGVQQYLDPAEERVEVHVDDGTA